MVYSTKLVATIEASKAATLPKKYIVQYLKFGYNKLAYSEMFYYISQCVGIKGQSIQWYPDTLKFNVLYKLVDDIVYTIYSTAQI